MAETSQSGNGTAAPVAGHHAAESQWRLIGRRFAKHRVAVLSLAVLAILYLVAAGAEFFAPYPANWRDIRHAYCPPQPPRFDFRNGLHTFTASLHVDPVTYRRSYVEERARVVPLGFFVKGEPYRFLGLIPCTRHFFGVDRAKFAALHPQAGPAESGGSRPTFFLLGADSFGRDLFSRVILGSRISLSVGLLSIAVTFLLGVTIGGLSGYVGGRLDTLIQRTIEIIGSFPHLPLWLALSAAMPAEWSPLRVYFAITIVIALLSWPGLARVVRGKLLSLREEDYAVAARLIGAGHARIIFRHLVPGFTSHIIVVLTLSVPGMIMGETSLSFLGLGLRPPVVSWGVMLQDCMNPQAVQTYPWLLFPSIFVVLTVLCFNFLGDGLRDAADPYSTK